MSFFSAGSVGSYRIVEELGAVPGGEACRAVDTRSGSPVLLKALPRTAGADAGLEDGLAEVRRLSRIDRPGIPAVYEVREAGGAVLLAFTPAPGRSLRRYVADGGRVGRRQLVDWLCRCLELLAEVHSQEVLHRHIGPETVVLGDDGELWLTGFSLTQLSPDAAEFRPPEARDGGRWTVAADLYALGALFERLAAPASLGGGGERPLDPGDPLLAVFARATAGEPGERFGDAAEMELAVRAAARAEAAPAVPATGPAAGAGRAMEAGPVPSALEPTAPASSQAPPRPQSPAAAPEAPFVTQLIQGADLAAAARRAEEEAARRAAEGAAVAAQAPTAASGDAAPAAASGGASDHRPPEPAPAPSGPDPGAAEPPGVRPQQAAAAVPAPTPGTAPGGAAAQERRPGPTVPAQAPRRSALPWVLVLVLLLLALGGWWAWRQGLLPFAPPPAREAPAPEAEAVGRLGETRMPRLARPPPASRSERARSR